VHQLETCQAKGTHLSINSGEQKARYMSGKHAPVTAEMMALIIPLAFQGNRTSVPKAISGINRM
jgi:hypothetical protein